ncbi:MAG: hypothetical protein HZC54_24675 [Verrucomicrobia bacterium]|nr:hypothetical protein [Verrucomicrobiota bacterium]
MNLLCRPLVPLLLLCWFPGLPGARGGEVAVKADQGGKLTLAEQPKPHLRRQGDCVYILPDAVDDDLAALKTMQGVKRVFAEFRMASGLRHQSPPPTAQLSAAGLAHLKGLKELEVLILLEMQLTDDGLAQIGEISGLRELWLDGDRAVTDKGLAHLSGLKQLRVLRFFGAPITDAGLAHIKGLTELQTLLLGYARVTDAGMPIIAGFHKLKTLDLQNTGITDAGLASLGCLTTLDWLCFRNTRITSDGLSRLQNLTNLTWLFLDDTDVGDDGLKHLKKMSKLKTLGLCTTKVLTEQGLSCLAALQNLERLRLRRAKITGAGLASLVALSNLKELELVGKGVPAITEAEINKLWHAMPKINISVHAWD